MIELKFQELSAINFAINLVESCKKALGPYCIIGGTPCLYPCEKMGIECRDRHERERNIDACVPQLGSSGGHYA